MSFKMELELWWLFNTDVDALSIQTQLQHFRFKSSSRYHRCQRRKPRPILLASDGDRKRSKTTLRSDPVGIRISDFLNGFLYFCLSLPVLLLIWSVAVAWLFPTSGSWSSTLLLVCICWEVRVKHQRLRGKIISSTHLLLFYFHKNALLWSICSCFWPKGSITAWGD